MGLLFLSGGSNTFTLHIYLLRVTVFVAFITKRLTVAVPGKLSGVYLQSENEVESIEATMS